MPNARIPELQPVKIMINLPVCHLHTIFFIFFLICFDDLLGKLFP